MWGYTISQSILIYCKNELISQVSAVHRILSLRRSQKVQYEYFNAFKIIAYYWITSNNKSLGFEIVDVIYPPFSPYHSTMQPFTVYLLNSSNSMQSFYQPKYLSATYISMFFLGSLLHIILIQMVVYHTSIFLSALWKYKS